MAIVTSEIISSRTHSGKLGRPDYKVNYEYVTTGTSSDIDARNSVIAAAPATITVSAVVLYRESISIRPENVDTANKGCNVWFSSVEYVTEEARDIADTAWETATSVQKRVKKKPKPEDIPDYSESYNSSPVQVKRYYSLETVAKFPATGGIDTKGGIEIVSKDGVQGQPNGVDVYIAAETFSIKDKLSFTYFMDNKATWSGMTNHVNNDTFKGYAVGELLFMGYNANTSYSFTEPEDPDDEDFVPELLTEFDVTFNFAVSKNGTPDINAASLPSPMTPALSIKKGWDYLWILREISDTTAIPKGVYYERVYPVTAFNGKGIPID